LQTGQFGFTKEDNIATPTAPKSNAPRNPQMSSSLAIENELYAVSLKDSFGDNRFFIYQTPNLHTKNFNMSNPVKYTEVEI